MQTMNSMCSEQSMRHQCTVHCSYSAAEFEQRRQQIEDQANLIPRRTRTSAISIIAYHDSSQQPAMIVLVLAVDGAT